MGLFNIVLSIVLYLLPIIIRGHSWHCDMLVVCRIELASAERH